MGTAKATLKGVKGRSIGTRLLLGFLLVNFVFTVATAASYREILQLRTAMAELGNQASLRAEIANLVNLSQQLYLYATDVYLMDSQGAVSQFEIQRQEFRKTAGRIRARLSTAGEELQQYLAVVERHEESMSQIFTGLLVPAVQSGETAGLRRWYMEMQTSRDNVAEYAGLLYLASQQAEGEALARVEQAIRSAAGRTLVGVGVALALGLLLAWFFGQMIKKPLTQLVAYSRRIAGGDLTGEAVVVRSRDEIGQLLDAFNEMKDSLRQLIVGATQLAREVETSTQQLAATTEEVGQAGRQVAITIQEIARGTGEQTGRLQGAALAVDELAERIGVATRQIGLMAASVQEVAGHTVRGDGAVREAVAQMEKIRLQVDRSTRVVEDLGRRSQEVDQIVALITSIADQTNLLALNAAIEAARAGEQGRGFAVVAEEVRKLAEQAGQSAGRIGGLIKEIQAETGRAVRSMQEGTDEVARGIEVINHTGASFATIKNSVEHLAGLIRDLEGLSAEMAAAGASAREDMTHIASLTEETAAGAQQVTAASEEQAASVEQIVLAVQGLSRMVEDLIRQAGRFRV